MTATGYLYITEDCKDTFEEEMDIWFGKDNWSFDASDYNDCWNMDTFPNKIIINVLNKDDEVIGKVEITTEFYVDDDGYEKSIGYRPKKIKIVGERKCTKK